MKMKEFIKGFILILLIKIIINYPCPKNQFYESTSGNCFTSETYCHNSPTIFKEDSNGAFHCLSSGECGPGQFKKPYGTSQHICYNNENMCYSSNLKIYKQKSPNLDFDCLDSGSCDDGQFREEVGVKIFCYIVQSSCAVGYTLYKQSSNGDFQCQNSGDCDDNQYKEVKDSKTYCYNSVSACTSPSLIKESTTYFECLGPSAKCNPGQFRYDTGNVPYCYNNKASCPNTPNAVKLYRQAPDGYYDCIYDDQDCNATQYKENSYIPMCHNSKDPCPSQTKLYQYTDIGGYYKCNVGSIRCQLPDKSYTSINGDLYCYPTDCPNSTYEFNNACYDSCPPPSKLNETKNGCECLYHYYEIEIADGVKHKICLEESDPCPGSNLYLVDNNTCMTECPTGQKKRKITTRTSFYYQCTESCTDEEYSYTDKASPPNTFCLSKCPIYAQYHLENETKCLDQCPHNDYYTDSLNHICYLKCPGAGLNIPYYTNVNEKKGYCVLESECPVTYSHLYEQTLTCFDQCSNAAHSFYGNAIYLDIGNNTCVSSCYGKYKKNQKCYEECATKEFIKLASGTEHDNVCVENCGTAIKYIIDSQTCLPGSNCQTGTDTYKFVCETGKNACCKTCPEGTYEQSGTCVTCNGATDFIIEKTKTCETGGCTSSTAGYKIKGATKGICYEKCPEDYPYYNYNENECYSKKGETGLKDNQVEGTNIFVPDNQCSSTSAGVPGYTHLFNHICYQTCPENSNFTDTDDKCDCIYRKVQSTNGIICLGLLENCPVGYEYILDGECVPQEKCLSGQHIRKLDTSPINYECRSNCSEGEYEYKTKISPTKEYIYCLKTCPEDKPYHFNNQTECLSECGKNKFTDSLNYLCYDLCPNLNTREESIMIGTKLVKTFLCLNSETCPPSYPYFYNETKSCLSSCQKTQEKKLFLTTGSGGAVTEPTGLTILDAETKECIPKCRDGFLNDTVNNECVDKCGDDQFVYKKICVRECPTNTYLLDGTNECLDDCTGYHYVDPPISDPKKCYKTCPLPYYQDDLSLKCLTSCSSSTSGRKYLKENTHECVSCSLTDGNESQRGYLYNKVCYQTCPNEVPYHDKDKNECIKGCTSSGKLCHIKEDYECLDCADAYNCTYKFNYVCYTDGCPGNADNTTNVCKCRGKHLKYKQGDKELYTCLEDAQPCPINMPYYYSDENQCLASCKDTRASPAPRDKRRKILSNPINYQCIATPTTGESSCASDEYVYTVEEDGRKVPYCVQKCPEVMPYHNFNDPSDKNCKSSCDLKTHYVDIIDHICYKTCPGYNILDDTDLVNRKGFCIDSISCPSYAPYLYKPTNSCITDCALTKTSSIFPKETTLLNEETKECVFDNVTCDGFYDNTTGNCKRDCDNNQYKFTDENYNKTCYDSAQDCIAAGLYYIEETKDCLLNCSDRNYYTVDDPSNKKCYSTCPGKYYSDDDSLNCSLSCNSGKYKKISNKKCVTCEGATNINFMQENQGFIDGDFCYDRCPDINPFYIHGQSKCYNENDTALANLLKIENTYEYTDNCMGYIFNNICYLSGCPTNSKKGSDNKCICSNKYYYLVGNSEEKITFCLSITEPCPADFPFYGNDKKCKNETCNLYRVINSNPVNYQCIDSCSFGEFEYKNETEPAVCVSQCPEDKPYHVYRENKCYANCSEAEGTTKDYFIDEDKKICYPSHELCPGLNMYNITEDDKLKKDKCLTQTECPQGYYLFDKTKSCVANCSFTNNDNFEGKEETMADDEKKKCIGICSIGQYLDKTKTPNKCVEKCPDNTFIDSDTCVKKCPTERPKHIVETRVCVADSDEYYKMESDTSDPTDLNRYLSCPEKKESDGKILYQDEKNHKCFTEDECTGGSQNRYIKESIRKCVSCKKPELGALVQEDEGFIIDYVSHVCADACNSTSPYYNFDGNGTCFPENDPNLHQYNIENTYLFTNTCPHGYYLFNDICYKDQCPLNSQYNNLNPGTCKCSYKFTKDIINDKTVYNCLSVSQSCPENRTMFDKNEGCIEKCPNKARYTKSSDSAYSENYECLDKCGSLEYTLNDTTNLSSPIEFCVDKCPDGLYHNYGEYLCLESCDENNYFVDELNKICYLKDQCPYVKVVNESLKALGECLSTNKCPMDTVLYVPPFERNNLGYCLPNCSVTNSNKEPFKNLFGKEETFLYEDAYNNQKKCISSCAQTIEKIYLSVNDSRCVSKCDEDQFFYNNTCIENCSEVNLKYYTQDTRECVTDCASKNKVRIEFLEDNICYASCPNKVTLGSSVFILYKSYNDSNCVKCTEEQGFYVPDDPDRLCYPKCPDNAIRYNNSTNKCFSSNCQNPFSYEKMDTHECVTECESTYKIFNLGCYKQCSDPDLDIVDDEKLADHCRCRFRFYIDDKNSNYPTIRCLKNETSCPISHPYINESSLECLKECPLGTYADDNVDDPVDKKKCYENCTQFNLFTNEARKKCVKECKRPSNPGALLDNEGFYIDNGEKICLEKCPEGYRFYDSGGNKCRSTGCTNLYPNRIENTYECIKDCPEGYHLFNYICYKGTCPENSEFDSVTQTCNCTYKYYIKEEANGKKYKVCLGENEPCPETHKYFDHTNQCTKVECKNNQDGYKFYKQISSTVVNYQCVHECGDNEFVHIIGTGANEQKYCVKECPTHLPFRKSNETNCLAKCDKFTDKVNHICYETCPGLVKLNEDDFTKGECLVEEKCPIGIQRYTFENEDKKYCISNCSLTKENSFPGKMTTYRVVEKDENNVLNSNYLCVANCSSMPVKKFIDSKGFECVEKCGENGGGEYFYDGKCYDKCSSVDATHIYYLSDTKECVESCPENYFKEGNDKACYRECPLTNKEGKEIFTDTKNKMCSLCEQTNTSPPEVGKGFILKDEPSPKKCYQTCPTTSKYFNHGLNICFPDSCLNSNKNPYPSMIYSKYTADHTGYECFSSCEDIYTSSWNGYRTEDYQCLENSCPNDYPYEYEKICYKKGCPYSQMKIKKNSNINECYYDCPLNVYLQGSDCVATCDTNHPYKIEKSSTLTGLCLTETEGCSINGYEYFDKSDKKCLSSCPGPKKMIETDMNTGKPYISSVGTCVSSCPVDFPYESNNICYKNGCPPDKPFTKKSAPHTCLSDCPNIFEFDGSQCVDTCLGTKDPYYLQITSGSPKKCVNKCPDFKKYFKSANGECLSECKDTATTFTHYNPLTNECVDSCSSVSGYEYYIDDNTKPLPCLSSCPAEKPYHNETEKECLSECPGFYSAENNYLCVSSCGGTNKRLGISKMCSKECTVNYPYLIAPDSAGANQIDEYTCIAKCDNTNTGIFADYKYILSSNKQCVKECPPSENYLLGGICYPSCPNDYLYYIKENDHKKCLKGCSGSTPFHLEGQYECRATCPNAQRYILNNTNICLNKCPPEYPHDYAYTTSGTTANISVCSDTCESGKVFSDNLCLDKCDQNYKPFYLSETNTCYSECPQGYQYYEITTDPNFPKKCFSSCGSSKFISPSNQCITKCPENAPFIIGKRCKEKCEEQDGTYFYESGKVTGTETYSLFTCTKTCPDNMQYRILNDSQCYGQCPSNSSFKTPDNYCYAYCKDNEKYPFTLEKKNGEKVCSVSCDSDRKYYDTDKICLKTCNESSSANELANEFNQCVQRCNISSNYKFEYANECLITCPKEAPKYVIGEYKCLENCTSGTKNYLRPGNVCEDSCDKSSAYPYEYSEDDKIVNCLLSCPAETKPYYYKNEKKCLQKCYNNEFVIQDTKECVQTCSGLTETPFTYLADTETPKTIKENTCVRKCYGNKPFLMPGNTCSKQCENGYEYYKEEEKICLAECPEGYYTNGTICVNKCPSDQFLKNGKCVRECESITTPYGYKYYFPLERECLKSCGDGFYIENNIYCVNSCNMTRFAQGNECVKKCDVSSPYYIKYFDLLDTDPQRHCLTDCPMEYPFVKEGDYACMAGCPNDTKYFINDPTQNVKKCVVECNGNKHFVGDNNECLNKCPEDKPYFIQSLSSVNMLCYKECPYTHMYHFENSFECKTEEECTFIYFEKQYICLNECSESQYTLSTGKYCFDDCRREDGFFKTPDKKCVIECPSDEFLMADDKTNNCICQNLYYLNESLGKQECFNNSIKECKNTNTEYSIPLQNSKRCLKDCPTVLSKTGICLQNYECPENEVLKNEGNGILKCECKGKFYFDNYNNTVCMGENEACPYGYNYFDRENNECVKTCPGERPFPFDGYCYEKCPANSILNTTNNDTECQCIGTFYRDSNGKLICLDSSSQCPDNQLKVHGGIKCLTKCSGLDKIYYNHECWRNCPDNTSEIVMNSNDPNKKYGENSCRCNNPWYIDEKEDVYCSNDLSTSCNDFFPGQINYFVKDTKQCTLKCPDLYPYKFNYECFSDCEISANSYYNEILKTKENSKECECKGTYRIGISDLNNRTIIICQEEAKCNSSYLMKADTGECIEGPKCPENYLIFNKKCYLFGKCPVNTKYDSVYAGQCVCENLRYNKTIGNTDEEEIHCLDKKVERCPDFVKYLIDGKLECVNATDVYEGEGYKYVFNDRVYKGKCPFNTIIDTNENTTETNSTMTSCVCNPYYLWYIDEDDHNYLSCGYEKCPDYRPYHIKETNECLFSCKDRDMFLFKNTCYNSSCPNGTTLKMGSTYECIYIELNNASTIGDLYEMVRSDIIRYYHEGSKGGFLYSGLNASFQVVGIDKNLEQNKDIIMKNNLSYIDFSRCIEQIYKDNNLTDDEQVILLKMDLINGSNTYLINPVEYEIYSSKTGKQLSLTVCKEGSISISYPINYRINDYDNISFSGIKNDINSLYQLNKKLNEKYEGVDTFNHEDDIYHDVCKSCELDGKDLILRERSAYLYPNISFCEKNCSFNGTDFKEERINCLCTLKDEFDYKREQPIIKYNFTQEEIDNDQKGSTSLPVFTCFKSLEIKNNVGFGYCLAVAVAEAALVSLGASIGFSSLSSSITSKLNLGKSSNGNQNNIETENKNLNSGPANPPPKDEDLILNENTEFIPSIYCKMFFSYKDNGVTKEIKRSKLPFKVRPQTKFLYEPIPGATYKPVFKNPSSLKQNMIKIIDEEKSEDKKEDASKNISQIGERDKDYYKIGQNNNDKGAKGKDDDKLTNNNQNLNFNSTITNKKQAEAQKQQQQAKEVKTSKFADNNNAQPKITNTQMNEVQNSETLKMADKSKQPTEKKRGKHRIGNIKKAESEDAELYGEEDIKKYKIKNFNDFDKDSLTDSQNMWRANVDVLDNEDILYLMKQESRFKALQYRDALAKDNSNGVIIVLTFMADKILLTKTLLFLKRYDVFSVFFSLYLLCHIMLLGLITCFFDLDTISKIFNNNDFPNIGFYLKIGIITNLITWVIYRLLLCLIENNNRIMSHIALIENHRGNNPKITNEFIKAKTEKLICSIKKRMIIYFIIQAIIVTLCFILITLFCSVYNGTKKILFKAYGFALLEILFIRIIYGIILGILRKIALFARVECLYKGVKFFDVHLS